MRKKKKSKFKIILLVLVLVYIGYIVVSTQFSMNKINAEIKVKQLELSKIKDNNEKLQDEVNMSKTNAYYEKLARERLGLVKSGETPVTEKK